MALRTLAALLVVATSAALAACGGAGESTPAFASPASPTATPTPVQTPGTTPAPMLAASPAAIQFQIPAFIPSPQPITLSGTALATATSLDVSIADPTVVGVTPLVFVQAAPPTYAVFPIAHGTTTITFSAGTASTSVTAASGLCGRPDAIVGAALLFPRVGSTGVPPSGTTLYFVVYVTNAAPSPPTLPMYAHLIVGAHATLDNVTPLQIAAPPPGAATLQVPPPNTNSVFMSVPAPAMPAGASIRTQLYDDTCQLPILAGGFST